MPNSASRSWGLARGASLAIGLGSRIEPAFKQGRITLFKRPWGAGAGNNSALAWTARRRAAPCLHPAQTHRQAPAPLERARDPWPFVARFAGGWGLAELPRAAWIWKRVEQWPHCAPHPPGPEQAQLPQLAEQRPVPPRAQRRQEQKPAHSPMMRRPPQWSPQWRPPAPVPTPLPHRGVAWPAAARHHPPAIAPGRPADPKKPHPAPMPERRRFRPANLSGGGGCLRMAQPHWRAKFPVPPGCSPPETELLAVAPAVVTEPVAHP